MPTVPLRAWCALVLASATGCGRVAYDARDARGGMDAAILGALDAPGIDAPSMDAAVPGDGPDAPAPDAPAPDAPFALPDAPFSDVPPALLDAPSMDAAFVFPDAPFPSADADGCEHVEASGPIARTTGHTALGTGPFTFEAWVRTPSSLASGVAILLGNRDAGPPHRGYLFGFYSGQPFVQLSDTPNIRCGPTLADEGWHHVAFERDGAGALSCFVDFVAYAPDTSTSTRDLPMIASLVVGDDTVSSTPFAGGLWMARTWSVERSAGALAASSTTRFDPGTPALLFQAWLAAPIGGSAVSLYSNTVVEGAAALETWAVFTSGCPLVP